MSYATIDSTVAALGHLAERQRRPFAVVLHGGEPLLLGYKKLEYLLSSLRDAMPDECAVSLQTNGVLLDERILDLCSGLGTTISISLDGPEKAHDKHRVGHTGKGTYAAVIKGLELLRNYHDADLLFCGVLAVVDPETNPAAIYAYFKQLAPPSLDFIYRDGNHSKMPYGKASFYSTEYGGWMTRLAAIYLRDPAPTMKIRILDDLIKLILGGSGTKDGVGITSYGVLIVDTDGRITKNDTLKSAFNGADKFTSEWRIGEDDLLEIISSDEFLDYHHSQRPTSHTCMSCTDLKICGGGMALHRWRDENGYDNPSVFCSDQRHLINYLRSQVLLANQ
jgi:uncharacterized protein